MQKFRQVPSLAEIGRIAQIISKTWNTKKVHGIPLLRRDVSFKSLHRTKSDMKSAVFKPEFCFSPSRDELMIRLGST